ncbi:MAG: hypothetical protein ACRC1K_24650 [Planctomycetia bacterium]
MVPTIRYALGLTVIVAAVGCDGAPKGDVPSLVPVKGTVMVNGQPFTGGLVTYLPQGDTRGTIAYGATDDKGGYVLESPKLGKGTPAGKYRVTVGKMVMADGSPIPANTESIALLKTKNMLAPVFSDPQKTILIAEVQEGSEKPIDFDLK